MKKKSDSPKYTVNSHQYYVGSIRQWLILLWTNGGVEFCYLGKAIRISFFRIVFWPLRKIQAILFNRKIQKHKITQAPVFIIGHWRSGTTHLQYLLSRDPKFGYLSYYHSFFPGISLLGGKIVSQLLNHLMPAERPQDKIKLDMDLPTEEEPPMACRTLYAQIHSWFFGRNMSYLNKYCFFEGISEEEKSNWQKDYYGWIKEISFQNSGKILLLKNPPNTSRIKELLTLFPQARFIHIHRNPFTVFPSTRGLWMKVIKSQFLQKLSDSEIVEVIFRVYRKLMTKYLAERDLIPEGQFVELSFEELENAPIEALGKVYKTLHLDGFMEAKPYFEEYLHTVKSYQKNKYQMKKATQKRIQNEWSFALKEWAYTFPEGEIEVVD